MKKLAIILFLISTTGYAQKAHLYLGVKTLHGVHALVNYDINENNNIGLQLSYYHAFVNKTYISTGNIIPIEFLFQGINQQGFGIGFKYSFLSENKKLKWHNFTLEYQKLESGIYMNDERKFAGTTQSNYDEFYDKYRNFAFSYGVTKGISGIKYLEYFYEYGIIISTIDRQYTIEGTYSSKTPSDRKQTLFRVLPFGRVGLNVKIF